MSERLDASIAHSLGVYVHWPFCLSICPYCDFNVHVFKNVNQDSWLKAYAAEIQHLGNLTDYAHPVTSVFFGGGTPSLVRPDILEGVLNEIASVWGLAQNAEISLEANPVGLDRPLLEDLK
ncbi:MAG: radical SAM protein, partial [Pseudomonadota bacterium]|nr:radical SAM protein [Pseudomonadota bacterium]